MDLHFDKSQTFMTSYKLDDDNPTISDSNNFPYQSNDWEIDQNYMKLLNLTSDPLLYQPYSVPVNFAPHSTVMYEGSSRVVSSSTVYSAGEISEVVAAPPDHSLDDADFSETIRYISQMLMEENFEQKPSMFYDPLSLQVTEKSFYDALRRNHPHSPNEHPLDIHHNIDTPDDNCCVSTSSIDCDKYHEANKPSSSDAPVFGDHVPKLNSQPMTSEKPCQLVSAYSCISDGLADADPFFTRTLAQTIFTDAESVSQFKRGLEEASKFLPRGLGLIPDQDSKKLIPESMGGARKVVENIKGNSHGSKGRKNHEREASSDTEEGRSNKQSAVFVDEVDISDMFDNVLLSVDSVPLDDDHKKWLHSGADKAKEHISEQPNLSNNGVKTRGRRPGRKKEAVDLRTLMALCAQAVSANDYRSSNELLKQIRQHSSQTGDASQRLAHYFANGLEARLSGCGTGTGSQIFYASLSSKRISSAQILRAYSVLISVCPFRRFSYFFANRMIFNVAEKAETLHIVDFGIQYGFQWPILIKFLSQRVGGPPKLRITGIELPRAGFRPAELIEETGRRLSNYCKRFNVPFEYKAIASQNWETIPLKDFKIERNECLVVNCLQRFKNLLDETIEVKSPRDAIFNLIRKMNPDIFVLSTVNGSYNAPFFASRFKEAMFHYSAMFDMFDTVIPRDNEWRLMLEREFFGREIMNVVAYEGVERVERPETYKHWQVRATRAGFRQLPLLDELMAKFREKLKAWYHKDFVIDEDNNWMLQGWKGRIICASTCWVPS